MCTCECLSDIVLVILSVLFPPLPVWIRRGICTGDSLINILLCVLGYLPGLIHSWYIIAKYPPYSVQESRVYYVVQNPSDLEAGRGITSDHHHHHNHYHTHNYPQDQTITAEPHGALGTSYGSTRTTPRHDFHSSIPPQTPPAYSEFPLSK